MIIVAHRINTLESLKAIPKGMGVELDVRSGRNGLILNHEPDGGGQGIDAYLKGYRHKLAVLDVKEEGIERKTILACQKHDLKGYFLLGVSFPSMLSLSEEGFAKMAVRFSEYEGISTALSLAGKADWAWVDTFTKNPLDPASYDSLRAAGLKICLVSPDRWGRPTDISPYAKYFRRNGIRLDAVMVDPALAAKWGELQ